MTTTSIDARRDEGLTLIEMIIVITVIGGVVAVIAATMLVVLKVAPSAEYRIDDARSTRGLQTWLARDIASTPPQDYNSADGTGFVDALTSLSAAGVPAGDLCSTTGTHVLFMAWEDGAVSYRAQYTIEPSGGSFEVVRRLCGGDTNSRTLTGGVLDLPCPSGPHSELIGPTDADGDGELEAVVELCFLSAARKGSDTQPVTLSVASRNGDS